MRLGPAVPSKLPQDYSIQLFAVHVHLFSLVLSFSLSDSLGSSESVLIKTQGTLKSAPLPSFPPWFSLSPLEVPRTSTFAVLLLDLKLFARNKIPGEVTAELASDFAVFSFGSKGNLEVDGCC